jgi:hypothetical protein
MSPRRRARAAFLQGGRAVSQTAARETAEGVVRVGLSKTDRTAETLPTSIEEAYGLKKVCAESLARSTSSVRAYC